MPISVQDHELFTSELLNLTVDRTPGADFFSLEISVRIVNKSTGASAVMKLVDLPTEIQEDLRLVLAGIELHSGSRFFGDIQ